ncbi:MAG TPA: FkbM family methyltransferase, partial [Mycobacteriales bacterium]|nr:FkbM family methyltransferase [Mycobacteriales bacterium]
MDRTSPLPVSSRAEPAGPLASAATTTKKLAARMLRDHHSVSKAVAAATERCGRTDWTDKINRVRSYGQVATVRLPADMSGRRPALALQTCRQGDNCATTVGRRGWQAFEPPMPDVFVGECRASAGHVLDVGANTGFYSLVAVLANPELWVQAFEPVPYVAEILTANVRLNRLDGRVALQRSAVGTQDGSATLHLPPRAAGVVETSASLSPDFKDAITERLEVAVRALDSWWGEVGQPPIGVIKVDVESRELDVLRGAEQLVRRCRPVIFYELLPQGDAAGLAAWARERELVDIRLRPREAVVGDPPQFDPDAWNHMFVPVTALDPVVDRLRAAGLAITAAEAA